MVYTIWRNSVYHTKVLGSPTLGCVLHGAAEYCVYHTIVLETLQFCVAIFEKIYSRGVELSNDCRCPNGNIFFLVPKTVINTDNVYTNILI